MPTIRPQPDLSPSSATFVSSASTSNPVTSGSVRRNLFSAHLSRRPASGSRPQSQSSSQGQTTSQTTTQPPSTRDQQQQYAQSLTQTPNNHSEHHHALPQVRTHQRSVSTPSLSPSPPRVSPYNHPSPASGLHPTFNPGHQYQSPPYPQLQTHHHQQYLLHPTSSHRAILTEGYDPTISPNRPLSPRSTATLFPNSSIIALNPLTGRPVLPHLPNLPGRLRLSESDDEQEPAEDEAMDDAGQYTEDEAVAQAYQRAGHPAAWRQHAYGHTGHQDPDHIQAAAALTAEAEAEADEERRDRERIERLLREMMARQRARAAKSKSSSGPNGVGANGIGPSSRSTQSHSHLRGVRGRRRRDIDPNTTSDNHRLHMHERTAGDIGTDHNNDHGGYFGDIYDNDNDHDHDHDTDNEVGGETRRESQSSEAEREELMGLILGSLQREVARADEEAWMFGEVSTMGAGVGRDEVGVYD